MKRRLNIFKDKSCKVNLSGAINWNKSILSYRKDMNPVNYIFRNPKFYSTNAKIKNMKWTNHPDKRCFARLPAGCDRALGELNKKHHSEYNNQILVG